MILFFILDYTVYSHIVLCISTQLVPGEGKGRGKWIGVWHINQRKETEPHQQEERKLNPANAESRAINLTCSLPRKKGTSGENIGEIQIYYWISALILQKSLKGKCLNTLGSNLTPFYPPLWRGTGLCSQGALILLVTLLFFHLEGQHASITSPERKVASTMLSTDSTFNEKRQTQHHSLALLCIPFNCAVFFLSSLSPSAASHLGLTSE